MYRLLLSSCYLALIVFLSILFYFLLKCYVYVDCKRHACWQPQFSVCVCVCGCCGGLWYFITISLSLLCIIYNNDKKFLCMFHLIPNSVLSVFFSFIYLTSSFFHNLWAVFTTFLFLPHSSPFNMDRMSCEFDPGSWQRGSVLSLTQAQLWSITKVVKLQLATHIFGL